MSWVFIAAMVRAEPPDAEGRIACSAMCTVALCPRFLLPVFACFLALTAALQAEDWPQWRGPDRTGIAEFEPPSAWPDELTLTWKTQVGPGDSSPVAADGRVYAFTRDGESESLVALDAETGEVLWRNGYPQEFTPLTIVDRHDKGPFSTPLVADGRVFTVGIREKLTAWSAEDGEIVWQRSFDEVFKRPQPFYGASQSPILVGGRLIVHVGGPGEGALQAFDPATGEDLWRVETEDGPAYGSGLLVELAGREQIVTLTQRRMIGFDPEDGEILWEIPYQVSFDAASVTPTIHQDLVIFSSDQKPVEAHRIVSRADGFAVEPAWSNGDVDFQFSSPVLVGGRLFGFSTRNKGQVVALDPATGELLWSGPGRQGDNAYLIAAGPVVLVVRDTAEMDVIDPSADEYRPLASYEVGESWMWSHPALLDHALLVKDFDGIRRWELVPEPSG